LAGKTAIITGAGSGIGRGIAIRLFSEGCNLVICGRREASLKETAGHLAGESQRCIILPADVTLDREIDRIVDAAVTEFGGTDFLINNAGVYGGGEIHEHDVEVWDRVMAINLRAPFLLSRALLPGMRERGGGHIINISSESALEHYRGNGAYGVSKHALNALGEYIQRENQDDGIRVDTICPGMVVTEMTDRHQNLDREKCLIPEDIADLVFWLLSRRPNIKIGTPILIQTMMNPWE
jgi:NAD(P)-dependent dehydrogenase (short-subunit alcohol dehydrogenase family)